MHSHGDDSCLRSQGVGADSWWVLLYLTIASRLGKRTSPLLKHYFVQSQPRLSSVLPYSLGMERQPAGARTPILWPIWRRRRILVMTHDSIMHRSHSIRNLFHSSSLALVTMHAWMQREPSATVHGTCSFVNFKNLRTAFSFNLQHRSRVLYGRRVQWAHICYVCAQLNLNVPFLNYSQSDIGDCCRTKQDQSNGSCGVMCTDGESLNWN